MLLSNQKEAPAKAGAIAPVDVFVSKTNTGLGPEKTSFFQALSIPTKITKGTIEIMVRYNFLEYNQSTAGFKEFQVSSQIAYGLSKIAGFHLKFGRFHCIENSVITLVVFSAC